MVKTVQKWRHLASRAFGTWSDFLNRDRRCHAKEWHDIIVDEL